MNHAQKCVRCLAPSLYQLCAPCDEAMGAAERDLARAWAALPDRRREAA